MRTIADEYPKKSNGQVNIKDDEILSTISNVAYIIYQEA